MHTHCFYSKRGREAGSGVHTGGPSYSRGSGRKIASPGVRSQPGSRKRPGLIKNKQKKIIRYKSNGEKIGKLLDSVSSKYKMSSSIFYIGCVITSNKKRDMRERFTTSMRFIYVSFT